MNAGEAVFQGREGTGLAQILHWQDAKPINVPWQQIAMQKANERRLALEQQKMRDDYVDKLKTMKHEGRDYFAEEGTADIQNYLANYSTALGQSNDINSAGKATVDQLNEIQQNQAKQKASVELEKQVEQSIKADPFADDEFASTKIKEYNYPISKKTADLNMEGLNNLVGSPRVFNKSKYVEAFVKPIKEMADTQNYQGLMNTPLGQYVVMEGNKARFGTIKDGKAVAEIPEGLIDVALNERYSDRIRFDLAKQQIQQGYTDKNGNRIPPDPTVNEKLEGDYGDILQRFNEIRYDKQYAPQVRDQVRKDLSAFNQITERDAISGSMKYPSAGNGYGNQNTAPKISEGTVTRISKDANTVFKNNGLVAVEGPSVDLQGMLKASDRKLTLADKTGDLIGFGPDPNTGKKSIILRGKENKFTGKYDIQYAPFDEANRNAIVKYNSSLSKVADEYSKMPEKNYHVDDEKIDGVVEQIKTAVKAGKDDSDTTTKLQQVLSENGIKVPADMIEVDKTMFGKLGTDDLKINGEKFPMNEKGLAELRRYIINNDIKGDNPKMQFVKERGAQKEQPANNQEDFDTQWSKLKPGETLVGPDGKTYKKK